MAIVCLEGPSAVGKTTTAEALSLATSARVVSVVSAMYGGLTSAAGSIMPALVLHSIGDTVVLTRWWLTVALAARRRWCDVAAVPC